MLYTSQLSYGTPMHYGIRDWTNRVIAWLFYLIFVWLYVSLCHYTDRFIKNILLHNLRHAVCDTSILLADISLLLITLGSDWNQGIGWEHSLMVRKLLIHRGRAAHICVGKLTTIGSDNGLSPGRRNAIIWTIAEILLIGPLGTNFSEILIRI